MTSLDARSDNPAAFPPAGLADAGAVLRVLAQIAGVQTAAVGLLLAAVFLTEANPARLPALNTMLRQGAAGIVGGGLVVSLTGTLCCLLLTWGRYQTFRESTGITAARGRSRVLSLLPHRRLRASRPPRAAASVLAGWPQGFLLLAGVALSCWFIYRFQPLPTNDEATDWSGVAGLTLIPAFLLIICERTVAAMEPDRLPEASRLAALLRIPIVMLLALSVFSAARGLNIAIPPESSRLLAISILAIDAELALRALGTWFLPAPPPERAQAAIGSLLAALLRPDALRHVEIRRRLGDQFGIDISRSWALAYARTAAPPVLLGLLLLAWALSGVTRVPLNERGSYERFGAPVAMLHSGLHFGLPWPFGNVRRVEFGVVHAVSIGSEMSSNKAPVDASTADGTPPLDANRLWDRETGTDISYLIASHNGTRQSFETVSVDVRVLYRIGMDDESARRALYGQADPDRLVRALSGRLLAQFFAKATLVQVLGQRREQVSERLRNELQDELDRRHSGLEIVALVVEAMHPPSGAAVAYGGVQSAQIVASTQRVDEIGRTYGVLSAAGSDARDAEDQAQSAAAEMISAAEVDRAQTDADIRAYRSGGQAFSLERYFSNLRAALSRATLEIVDSRLETQQQPLIDLRAPLAGASQDGRQ